MRWGWLLLSVVAGVPALAAEPSLEDLKKCATLSGPTDRLMCYDRALPPHEPEPVPTPTETGSEWILSPGKSKLTDADEPTIFKDAKGTDKITWAIGCKDNATRSLFLIDQYVISYDGVTVHYRWDSKPAVTARWSTATNGKAVGLFGGGASIPFLKSGFGPKTLYLRVDPRHGSRIEAEFDVGNLEEAIKPVRVACKW